MKTKSESSDCGTVAPLTSLADSAPSSGRFPVADLKASQRKLSHKRLGRRGAAMVEFAIVLPILLMLLLGIIEMGRVMMLNQVATNASREACRRAVIPGTTDTTVLKIVNNYLDQAGVNSAGRTVTILNGSGTSTSLSQVRSHEAVTIEIEFPYAGNTWGFTRIMGQNNLVSRATMRRE